MAEDLGDRTEDATPRRLAEARSKGQVPKSQDLTAVVGLAVALGAVVVFGGPLAGGLAEVMRASLSGSFGGADGEFLRPDTLRADAAAIAGRTALLALPFVAAGFVGAYVVGLLQVGWMFTTEPLRPKPEKLDPVKGVKRLFNRQAQVRTLVSVLKLAVVVGLTWQIAGRRIEGLAALPALPLVAGLGALGRACLELALVLCTLLLTLAVADWFYQRWQHKRDLRMTKQQVKEERRDMDGDPEIKSRRMRLAREIARQRVATAVPTADVVVTNPTHFSVALKYDAETMRAPTVVAKGADELALRIRQLAKLADVPVVERPPLARALYRGCEVGDEISSEHYEAVAELLAYVYRLEEEAGRGRRPRPEPRREPIPA